MKINDIWTGHRKSSQNTKTRKDRLLMKCNLTVIKMIEVEEIETEEIEVEDYATFFENESMNRKVQFHLYQNCCLIPCKLFLYYR